MRLVLHPVLEELPGHPAAPLDLQHLHEVQAIHRGHDVAQREQPELAELAEKLRLIALLEGVVEVPVPVVELHFQPHQRQGQPDYGSQQHEPLRPLLGDPVGFGQGPESL